MSSQDRTRKPDAIDLRVAARLRQRRQELQVDPAVLDIVIGEPPGTVQRFEAGERRIPAAHLFRLGQALNVDIVYFFDEDADETTPKDASGRRHEAEKPPHAAARVVAEAQYLDRNFRRLPNSNLRRLLIRLIQSIATRKHGRK